MRRERALDDPRFGRAEPCACVLAETGEMRRERLERIGNLGALARFTFASFEPREGMPSLDDVAARARAWAESPEGWLVLRGPSGSGKTHLAAAIANARLDRDEPAYFTVVPDLLDKLRGAYEPAEGEPGFDALFEQVRTAPLLVLDDIDAAAFGDWAREKLFQIVNARHLAALPTVFTCHALPADERLATRLAAGCVLELAGEPSTRGRYRQIGGMTRERLEEYGFQKFKTFFTLYETEENESLQSARDRAQRFADSPDGWLLILGEHGCGKTHLAAAVAARTRCDVFFAVVPDLLDRLRASFDRDGESSAHDDPGITGKGYDELFEEVRNAGLLVLDDLDGHATSDWAMQKLFQIANYRASARLPTVITSALAIDELWALYPRVAVRAFNQQLSQQVGILAGPYNMARRDKKGSPNRPRRR